MSAFMNLPISRKLMAAFAAVVAVILVSSAVIYGTLGVIEGATSWRVHTADVLDALYTMTKAIRDQQASMQGYLVTGDESVLKRYHTGGDAFALALRNAKGLTSDNPAQEARLDELSALAKAWRGIAEQEIALLGKPETREAARVIDGSEAGRTAMDLIRAKIDEIDAVEHDLLTKRAAVQKQAYATAYRVTILGSTASLVVAMLTGFLLTRGVTVPVRRMTNAMSALAKGDTSVEVPGVGRNDEIGAMAAAVHIFRDSIIARNRAEKALQESEEKWKAVFENNPTMYFVVDAVGAIMSVNPFGAEQLGYRTDELVGRAVQNLFHEADREAVRRNTALCLEQLGRTMTWELRKIRKDGEILWVRETAKAMLLKGRPVILIVCENITENKYTAEALRDVQMELVHANRVATIGQLTASIAHDVNQPIAATVANAQAALRWLAAESPDLEEVRQSLARIVRDGNRAGEVIGQVRALIKKASPCKDRLDLNEAIGEVVALTHGEAIKNHVPVRKQFAKDLSPIEGDRVQLQQVILNLIINAIEAMSETDEPVRELLLSTKKTESDTVLVAVRDSGPGLAPAALERLFDAFYTTKPSGLGLGLSICRSIVEAHGGRLWATANLPRGAIFQFTLPARRDVSL